MAAMTDRSSLYLNLQSLIKIWAPDMPFEIRTLLTQRLGHFSIEVDQKAEATDITLLNFEEPPILDWEERQMNSLYGFSFSQYRGQLAFVFYHRGKPDIMVAFSDEIKIFYSLRANLFRKLYGILLFFINHVLNKKNGLLFHGALTQFEQYNVLFTGHRGIKKTMLLLTMLRNGWDYLSDDKLILHHDHAYLFEPFLLIRDHHIRAFPWLLDKVSQEMVWNKTLFKGWSGLRHQLGTLAERCLPKQFLPAIDRLSNPNYMIPIDRLFPERNIIQHAKPSIVLVLHLGSAFRMTPVFKSDLIDEITLIQKLAFYEFIPLKYMLYLYHQKPIEDLSITIDSNLKHQTFFKMTIPKDGDMDEVYREFIKCLKRVS